MELLAIAIAPAAILLFYVYQKDKYEREPLGLLFKIMVFGALACIPAAVLEMLIEPLLMAGTESEASSLWAIFVYAVLGVGLVEEGCKFFVLQRSSWRSPYFSQRFDGIVYAVSASLGFALLENILYVMSSGFSVGIMRALTAVPMHCAFGVFMGLQYGRDRFTGVPPIPPMQQIQPMQQGQYNQAYPMQQGQYNQAPMQQGQFNQAYPMPGVQEPMTGRLVPQIRPAAARWSAILIPTIVHGFYDFFIMASPISAWFLLGFAFMLIFSVGWAALILSRESKYA